MFRVFGRIIFVAVCALTLLHSAVFALDVNGVNYMSVAELARVCGMKYASLDRAKRQRVYGKSVKMDFEIHSRSMTLNGTTLLMGFPVVGKSQMLYIARNDYIKTISPILFPKKNGTPPKVRHIVIDAGHGDKDQGASNRKLGVKEKNLNLDIALRLGKVLQKNGFKVSYTRSRDKFIDLDKRPQMANSVKGDLFVSVHCNSAASGGVSGIETYALTPRGAPSSNARVSRSDSVFQAGNAYDAWNELLSYYVQTSLISRTKAPDRGAKRARFAVLRTVKMPAILVECGFVSNRNECSKLSQAKYRQTIAEAIAYGIMRYKSTVVKLGKK